MLYSTYAPSKLSYNEYSNRTLEGEPATENAQMPLQ